MAPDSGVTGASTARGVRRPHTSSADCAPIPLELWAGISPWWTPMLVSRWSKFCRLSPELATPPGIRVPSSFRSVSWTGYEKVSLPVSESLLPTTFLVSLPTRRSKDGFPPDWTAADGGNLASREITSATPSVSPLAGDGVVAGRSCSATRLARRRPGRWEVSPFVMGVTGDYAQCGNG